LARDIFHTATPIKHLIVVIGENRSFDHIFGVYKPRDDQRIRNLLSRGIVKEDGSPGPNFRAAAQFTVLPQAKYFIDAPDGSKAAYITLPPPDLHGVPPIGSDSHPPPFASIAAAQAAEPSLKPEDAVLLTTGASGLPATSGPDTRIANVTHLPNGPYQQTAKDPRNESEAVFGVFRRHAARECWNPVPLPPPLSFELTVSAAGGAPKF
jgi:phospholipase C